MDRQHKACLDLAIAWSSFGQPEARSALQAMQESWAVLFESFDPPKAETEAVTAEKSPSVTRASMEGKPASVLIPKELFMAAFDSFMKGFMLASALDAELMNQFTAFCSKFHTILNSSGERLIGLASKLHKMLSRFGSVDKYMKELYAFWSFIDVYPFYLNSAYHYAVPMTVMFFVTENISTISEINMADIVIAALNSFIKMNLRNVNHPAVGALAIVLRKQCDVAKVDRVPWMSNFPAGANSPKGFYMRRDQSCDDMDSLHRPVHKLLSVWISIINDTNDASVWPLRVPSSLLSVVIGHNRISTTRHDGLFCKFLPQFSTMIGGLLGDLFLQKVTRAIPVDEIVGAEQENEVVHPCVSKKRLNEDSGDSPFKKESCKESPTSPFTPAISLLGRRTNTERLVADQNEIQKAIERNFSVPFFLNNNIQEMLRKIEPPEIILHRNRDILLELQSLVSSLWPNARCELCGSVAMELDTISSNLDLSIRLGSPTKGKGEKIMDTLLQELSRNGVWENITMSKKQMIYVLSTTHKKSKANVDIILHVPFVHIQIAIIKTLVQLNPLLRDFIRVIKFWAVANELSSSSRGALNGIAFALMAIFHFQTRPIPALPKIPAKVIDYAHLELVTNQMREFHNRNNETMGELLISFFDLFGSKYDYDVLCISVHEGRALQKPIKQTREQKHASPFYIQDLSNPEYNVTKFVTQENLSFFVRGCQLALLKLSSQGKLVD